MSKRQVLSVYKGYLSLYVWSSGVSVNVRIRDPEEKKDIFYVVRSDNITNSIGSKQKQKPTNKQARQERTPIALFNNELGKGGGCFNTYKFHHAD